MFTNIKKFFDAYEVDSNEITEAKKQMEIQIPEDLKKFYQEVGYGFVKCDGGAFFAKWDEKTLRYAGVNVGNVNEYIIQC